MEKNSDMLTKTRQWETMAVFAVLFMILEVKFQRQVFAYLAVGFLLIALFVPILARIITLAWMKLSSVLARVNSLIILTLVFYLVLAPLAWLYRLFHHDPLGLLAKETGSYYHERNHTYVSADLEKMW
jgi:hypothetical protein